MTDNFEMIINGKKIEFPFNINEMFSQLKCIGMPNPYEVGLQERDTAQEPFPHFKPFIPQQRFVRKVIICKDTAVREVVMGLNERITRIEELLKLRKKTPEEKIIPNTKDISKTKEKPKVKTKPKEKPMIKPKSKDSKVKEKKISKKK